MARHSIGLIPADGIGPEVIGQTVRVLRALTKIEKRLKLDFKKFPWGSDFYHKYGRMCPESFLNDLEPLDAILLGAVGRPDIPDHITLNQLLLPIRRGFDLYVNKRPIILYEGLDSPLKNYGFGDIDILFFRENTEGEYSPIGGRHYEGHSNEIAAQITLFSRVGCKRIIEESFEASLKRKKHVTNVTKSNAQGHTLVLWDEIFEEVSRQKKYQKVKTDKLLVDAAALDFVRKPEIFDVIVSTNLFGDILTDLGAGIVGGLGIAASANYNPDGRFPGIFEPVHGSAPDIMGKGISNPVAALFSASMMLGYLGEEKASIRLDGSIREHLASGNTTPDLGGTGSTKSVATEIIKKL
ncbi:MAG: isocitrate/isopropylmalate family dehydrogenase [Nitrospinota bacterium]|nr:isocitrate/isopropylmalate family dehydrogenase [Nitrospinota bacterium]